MITIKVSQGIILSARKGLSWGHGDVSLRLSMTGYSVQHDKANFKRRGSRLTSGHGTATLTLFWQKGGAPCQMTMKRTGKGRQAK
jgi:hypothetical protein